MRSFTVLFLFFLLNIAVFSQNNISFRLLDSLTKENIPSAGVKFEGTKVFVLTDTSGNATAKNIPDGNYSVQFTSVGYRTKTILISLPKDTLRKKIKVLLGPDQVMMDEVVISSTRTHSHMGDSPLKVEVIGEDETEEENGIKPGNVSSLLGDVSGIQIQQTSPVSGNSNVRMLGLQGKYTQVLRDGIPMYEGFSADFGVMQLPPLDLKQIEIVKGSASTLYGGGAIAGIINLITKDPSATRDASTTLNYSSLTERNFNAFISQRFGKKGYTFFAGLTNQNAVDVNKDGFSDVPDIQYVTLHPKFYYYPDDNSRLVVGISGLYEKRMGGDMQVLHEQADATHTFFEKNESWRSSVDLVYDHTSQGGNIFTVKSTAGQYDRTSTTNTWIFGGTQYNSFSEVSYFIPKKNYDLVLGANFVTDLFQTTRSSGSLIHEVKNTTAGAFIQHTLRIGKKLVLETGLRVDEHNNYGTFILPRIAFLYKIDSVFSSRLNGGLGYKTPNPFAKEFQDYDPNTINPVADPVKAEHSAGGGFDLVCDKKFNNGLHLFADQSFFYTTINAPVIPQTNPYNEIYFVNAGKPVTTAGSDTYVRLATEELELYFGYTYTHARQHYDTLQKVMPLYPAHRFATVFVYELGERWRAGVESSWFGSQFTPGGEKKPGYLFMALMVAHSLGKINLVLNCENLLDYRQSKVEQLVDPPNTNPVFKTLWAPIDGRVVNLSARFKF